MNDDESIIVCIMCNGVVAYDNYDKTKFFKHLRHDHSIFFNKLFIMAVNSFEEKTREKIASQFEKNENDNVENDDNLMRKGIDISNCTNLLSPQFYQDLDKSYNINQIEERQPKVYINDDKMNTGFDLEVINKNRMNIYEDICKSEMNYNNLDDIVKIAIPSSKVNFGKLVTKEPSNSNELEMFKNNEISIKRELANNSTTKEQSIIEPYENKTLDERLIKSTNINTNSTDDTIDDLDLPPASPGMESLIQEELKAFKGIPKNIILHQAYELPSVTIKEVSGYNAQIPDLNISVIESAENEKVSNRWNSNKQRNIKSPHEKLDSDKYRKEAYICELCNYSSFHHSKIWYHKQTHKAKFTCDICEKALSSKGALKHHMNIHTQEKIHQCTVCGKSFNFKSTCQKHEYTHGKKRPYTCELCEKGFVEKRRLNEHILGFHKGEKPFICPNCGTCFVRKKDLKIHEKVKHSNSRPYPCPKCTKSFKMSRILANHMRIHSGDKPFVCKVCQKAFSQSGTLANHKKFHRNMIDPGSLKNKK